MERGRGRRRHEARKEADGIHDLENPVTFACLVYTHPLSLRYV